MKRPSSKILIPPTASSNLDVLMHTFNGREIAPEYRLKHLFSYLTSGILAPFRQYERTRYAYTIENFEVQQAPVFVLGHWRSGTTFLHNLLSQDPQFAYINTYQSVFPQVMLSKPKHLFKSIMQTVMPKRRAGDNVQMHSEFPQEEEFALGNIQDLSFYYFWYFPKDIHHFFDQSILFKEIPRVRINQWKQHYLYLVKTSLISSQKARFLSKNPPHTGRIPQLLELFPDARFIHIYRNPIDVFFSTRKFITRMLPHLQYEKISLEEIEKNIFEIYLRLFQQYDATKTLIPKGHLYEIRMEDLKQSPIQQMQDCYQQLDLPHFEQALPFFESYIQSQKTYQQNKHTYAPEKLKEIRMHWGPFLKRWGYE